MNVSYSALGIVTTLTGWFAERFGIKRVYITLLGLFILGSALCAFAPSLPFLIAFRAVQGSGGGRLVPLWISLLFGAFPEKERGVAFGIYGIPLIVAPASVRVLGGFFVEYLIWHLNIRFLSIYPYCLLTTSDISQRALISDSVWKE